MRYHELKNNHVEVESVLFHKIKYKLDQVASLDPPYKASASKKKITKENKFYFSIYAQEVPVEPTWRIAITVCPLVGL